MPTLSLSDLQRRVEGMNDLPSLPAVLLPVLNQFNADADDIDLRKIVQLVSHDGALTTQILHMANSPLFGMRQRVSNLQAAALSLGVSRLRDIVTSCCLIQISPKIDAFDVASFWEHSLACALISRNLARKLSYQDPERAYLAGLVHDLGILVNMLLIPWEFSQVFRKAADSQRPLRDVEHEAIGITHDVSGDLLCTHWHLFDHLSEVIRRHHEVEKASLDPQLTAIVNIADTLCRISGLGYGYQENIEVTLQDEPAWKIIADQSPRLQKLDMVCFTLEIESYVKEVRALVSVLFRLQ